MESAFPTLKRGASKHCASGAPIRTLLMQLSIAAHSSLALDFIRELKVTALGGLAPSTMLRAGRPGIRRLRAMGFVIPRFPNARELGHPFVARFPGSKMRGCQVPGHGLHFVSRHPLQFYDAGTKINSAGEAEAGSAGEQPDRGITGCDSSRW